MTEGWRYFKEEGEMSMITMAMSIEASDAIGQSVVRVSNIPPDSTVHELVQGLLPRMRLPR